MNGKVTYHQQVSYCGKPRCRRCREGIGHGPYWYAYQTKDGRTTRTYIGKQLPPEIAATMEGVYGAAVPAREPGKAESPPSAQQHARALAQVRIYALGQLRLERGTGPQAQLAKEAAWQNQRVRSLLACLLSAPGRKLTREQVIEAVWPELESQTANTRLDRAVYSLRQVFEPARSKVATSPFLQTEHELLVLADQSQLWLDADAFMDLLAQARASNDPARSETLLEEALALYGGDFLPEEKFITWTLTRREFLLRQWIGLLLELADVRVKREDLKGAIALLDTLLAVDPANEAAVQSLIKLLVQQGRRGEALRAYKKLAAVLQQEYRIAPLPETRALYEALRAGAPPAAGTPSAAGTRPITPMRPQAGATRPDQSTAADAPAITSARSPATPLDSPSPQVSQRPAVQIGRAHQSPLVGRDEEIKQLFGMLTELERASRFKLPNQRRLASQPFDTQRRPQALLLMGEVGIGKTRLAEEVGREARRRNWLVAWSRLYAQEGSIPYRLWVEVLRKAMSQGRGMGMGVSTTVQGTAVPIQIPPQVLQRPLVYQPLKTLLPELQHALPETPQHYAQPPEQEQLRLWEAALELLTTLSESSPLLIVLDDLQWSDGSSCELLAYLSRRIQGYPILIIGTCRDRELPKDHPLRALLTDLQRERAVTTLHVPPLSDEQISTLVAHAPQMASLPAPIVGHIRERAAGNPFFAEELVRLIDPELLSSLSAAGETRALMASALDDLIPHLPDSITAVLNLRLSRLSPECHRLLNKAAVLGASFEFPVISALELNVPLGDEREEDEGVLELIEEALRSGMLTEEGSGTRITYHFWHPLLASHLYEELSAGRRASLHRRAAEVLRQAYKDRPEEGAALITNHLVLGGSDHALIAQYAELAGDRAYTLSAHPDAEKYYKLAVEHLEHGEGNDELLHESYLLERLAESVAIQGKNEDARQLYEQILELHEQLPTLALDEERLQEAQIKALLLGEIGKTWYNVGNTGKAREYYRQSEQVLLNVKLASGLAWARLRLLESYAYWREGNYDGSYRKAQEARELFEQDFKRERYNLKLGPRSTAISRILTGDPVDLGRTQMLLGLIANGAGRSTEALDHLGIALTLYEQHERQREIAIVCCNMGDVYLRKADLVSAQSVLRRSLMLAEKIGEAPLVNVILNNLGVLALRQGNLKEAEEWFKQGLALAKHIHDPVSTNMLLSNAATTQQEQGNFSEAGAYAKEALLTGRALRMAPCIGLALVAIGNLHIAQAAAVEDDAQNSHLSPSHLLQRAKRTLLGALALENLEAETRIEGNILLAQAELQLRNDESARKLALSALEEASASESPWLIARAQRLLGAISTAQGQHEEAAEHFAQAIDIFRTSEMRLELGRTLQQYGQSLLRASSEGSEGYQRGLRSLQEALELFKACEATFDADLLMRLLDRYGVMAAS